LVGMEQAKVDEKGRVVIPERIRQKVGVGKGSKIVVKAKHRSIVITKKIEPKEFNKSMEGFLKRGSPVQVSDPLKLKEIWS